MKISFVIPAYNEENYIALCLDAVKKEIARGSWDAEIIVANNASTDGTGRVASSFPAVLVVDEPRKGMVRARSAGYAASTGDLIANIDADTIMPAGWLAKVMDEFGRDPKLLALSGPYIYYDASWDARFLVRIFYYIGFLADRVNKMIFGTGSMLQGGNFVLRRSALEHIGGFDTSIEFWGEDADIARRVGKIGRVKYTFKLPMYSSGRRWQKDGLLKTGIHYVLNFAWISFFGKPYESAYDDIRFPEKLSPSEISKTLPGIAVPGMWKSLKRSVLVAAGVAGAALTGTLLGLVGFGLLRVNPPLTRANVESAQVILTTNIKEGYALLKRTVDAADLPSPGHPGQISPTRKLHTGP